MKLSSQAIGWSIAAIAFALRAGWVLLCWSRDGAALGYPDETLHLELARNLVTTGTLVSDDLRYAVRMPLYPLFLAPFAGMGDVGVLLARLAQAALGAVAVRLVYGLSADALGRRVGVAAGVLTAFDPYAIFFANLLLTETLFTLIGVGLVAASWRVASRPAGVTRASLVAVALLGAAAVLTRPSALGWVLLLWLALWVFDPSRRRGATRAAGYALALLLCLLPWGLRNRAMIGAPAWLSTNGGVTLYDAQGPQAKGDSDQRFLAELPELEALGEVERDRRLQQLAIEQMQRDPSRVLQLAGVKFLRTWNITPNVAEHRGGTTGLISAAFMILVLVGAAVGVVRTIRHGRLHALLWLPVVYFTLVHCVYVGSLRYRVPVMPFLEIVAAAAIAARVPRRNDTARC